MVKRSARIGRWVLPATAVFMSLALLWAVVRVVGYFVGTDASGGVFLDRLGYLLGVLAIVAGGVTLGGIAFLVLAIFQQQTQAAERSQLEQIIRRQGQLLEQLNESQLLSDRAKGVAFREKERDALRRAIREDLAKQDWEAAYHLIDEMQRAFGYHAEAERLRQEVDQQRNEAIRASMAAEMGLFRELLNTRDWQGALTEAEKLSVRYPDQELASNLRAEVEDAREAYKRNLLGEFKQAIDRSEFDRGVEILKELDMYLTPGEAAGLQEAARGVFKGRLHNLGVQFSMAISERDWSEALTVGRQIVEEFPNSRMAVEVRENLNGLRKRAAEKAPAHV